MSMQEVHTAMFAKTDPIVKMMSLTQRKWRYAH